MVELLRHRRTKEPATDRFHLNYRATSRLYTFTPCGEMTHRALGHTADNGQRTLKQLYIKTAFLGQNRGWDESR